MISPPPSPEQLGQFLAESGYWKEASPDQIAPLVYEELRRLAHHYMSGERPDHTLQTTALVNEAYVHLAGRTNAHWQNRNHFFAGAARLMRHILVNHAKSRLAAKRGGGAKHVELRDDAIITEAEVEQTVQLNEALERLSKLDRRKEQVVELKYFGGMSYEEIAQALDISLITVRRDWEFAKAWLHKELTTGHF